MKWKMSKSMCDEMYKVAFLTYPIHRPLKSNWCTISTSPFIWHGRLCIYLIFCLNILLVSTILFVVDQKKMATFIIQLRKWNKSATSMYITITSLLIICMAKADPNVHFTIKNEWKIKLNAVKYLSTRVQPISLSMKFIHGSTTTGRYSSRLLTTRGKNHVINLSQKHVIKFWLY